MISVLEIVVFIILMFSLSRRLSGFQLSRIKKSLLLRRDGLHSKRLEVGQEIRLRLGGIGKIVSKPKRGEWNVEVQGPDGQITSQILKTSDILSGSDYESSSSAMVAKPIATSNVQTTSSARSSASKTIMNGMSNHDDVISHIVPPEAHAQCRRWIIFSDLHVKGSSIETCEEVLKEVHDVALQKEAGIIFLGDFWHVRGSLSVELLNRVLRSLRLWTQPVIMIPGNHDQVSLGGAVHALEPLRYAFRPDQIMMISEPAVCLGALWIPYRRNAAVMKAVLAAATGRNDISMIFCHADVKGAFMNDNIQSQEGLEASDFPGGVPTYTGHFHKPHTIIKRESKVCYVGSPYQTSLSEAGQQKYLYCMTSLPPATRLNTNGKKSEQISDSSDTSSQEDPSIRIWQEESRLPIHIGKKFYKISMADTSALDKVNEGDKVVLHVRIGEEAAAEKTFADLKAREVEVELRHEGYRRLSSGRPAPALQTTGAAGLDETNDSSSINLIDPAEGVDPLTVFRSFMTSGGYDEYLEKAVEPASTTTPTSSTDNALSSRTALYTKVFEEGIATLSRLQDAANATGAAVDNKVHNLSLEYVKLSDFGPYGGKPVTYPLGKRGIVLLTADSSDGTGADSNGAGKTTLAMSVLWGLTGSMDARLAGDSKATDVAFDAGENSPKRTAEVTVVGSINGQSFELTRRRGPRKTDLLFSVNGTDLTKQSVKDTQDVVDAMLGVGNNMLQRCCFFGQHSHTLQSLLGLSDLKLKSELAMLVDTQIWAAALQDVRTRDRAIRTRVQELGIERRLRAEELQKAKSVQLQLLQAKEKIAVDYEAAVQAASKEMGSAREALSAAFGPLTVEGLQNQLRAVSAEISLQTSRLEPLRQSVMLFANERTSQLKSIDAEIVRAKEQLARLRATAAMSRANTNSSSAKLKTLSDQVLQLTKSADAQLANATALYKQSVSDADVPGLLDETAREIDDLRSRLSIADVTIASAKASLARIQELRPAQPAGQTGPSPAPVKRWFPAKQRPKPEQDPCPAHDSSGCPTCGQKLPLEKRQEREAEITREINTQTATKQDLIARLDAKKSLLDSLTRAREFKAALKPLVDRQKEGQVELASLEALVASSVAELEAVEKSLSKAVKAKEELETALRQQETQRLTELDEKEVSLKALQASEVRLRQDIEKMQRMEQGFHARQVSANSTVALQREKLRAATTSLESKNESIADLEESLKKNEEINDNLNGESIVLGRLSEVLGPRGIQQFLFISVIRQIEEIANNYLNVLADGGIQLSLQGEWDTEKIIKKVLVRAADGELRERGLAQLSGGQWRRVSLSLDLAFSEVVRRKGSLRCSLIVMDEILTHLDASGREAVGSVLRGLIEVETEAPAIAEKTRRGAMRSTQGTSDLRIVDNSDETKELQSTEVSSWKGSSLPSEGERASNQSTRRIKMNGGGYDTVLVILQDLSALEMEEAFDHVDIVVKKGDTSSITIDGELIP